MDQLIYHINKPNRWEEAKKNGYLTTDYFEQLGFIHCSTRAQILFVANVLYKGQKGLLLLGLDQALLDSQVRYEEPGDGYPRLFPHVYGKINLNSVKKIAGFEPDKAGYFVFPEQFEEVTTS